MRSLLEAESLFGWGLRVNADCSLCHQNMGDVLLRLDQPARAEDSIRRHLELLPRDADAHYSLGVALKGCDLVVKRGSEARVRLKTHLSSAASSTVHKSNCRALDALVDFHTGRRASRCAMVN